MRIIWQSQCTTLYLTIFSFLLYHSQDTRYKKDERKDLPEYDFIIVGAGSAGCVVANRLTEINEWNVLLWEAGREEPEAANIPGFFKELTGTDIDWNYRTQPDENACLINIGCSWSRGKVLGGSSTINYMLYVRANPEDFNGWQESGNLGWSYKGVLPYFKKSEDNRDKGILKGNSKYHQTGGYLPVERFPYTTPDAKIILRGLDEFGLKNMDINAESQLGSMNLQTTSINASRASTYKAFLWPIRGKGKSKKVKAKKEVIVCAGAIDSLKLLMLSGIGPLDELEKHGIDVIQNLSVGHNLQDHVSFRGIPCQIVGRKSPNSCTKKLRDLKYYLSTHRGRFSNLGVSTITAFLRTDYEKIPSAPDMQLLFQGDGDNPNYYNQFYMYPTLLTPKSRGSITLNDTDPTWGAPIIQARYLTEDLDMKRLVQGTRIALGLFNTTAFKENNFKLNETALPACDAFKFNSDEYWICVVKQYTTGLFHPVGTCKMGPIEDSEAVVDPRLRVHGLKNLCGIDASVMPNVPRGNINAIVVMIAEKACDMIKQKWLKYN